MSLESLFALIQFDSLLNSLFNMLISQSESILITFPVIDN